MKKYQQLNEEGLLSGETLKRVDQLQAEPLFSLHGELHTLLYAGILCLSTGLGVLIYQHLNSIGHLFILGFMAALTAGCFTYIFRTRQPFYADKIVKTGIAADYVLLLGCFSLLSLLAYLQFEYAFFGTRYGLATFVPTVILFYNAYRFDHQGVLSMAITNLAIWMGVSISPQVFFGMKQLQHSPLIWTYILLAFILLPASYFSEKFRYKAHFSTLYQHFGIHILFLSLLTAYNTYTAQDLHYLYLIALLGLAYSLFRYAVSKKSFYLILTAIVYGYIAASLLYMDFLQGLQIRNSTELTMLWHIVLPLLLLRYLYRLSKKLKAE